MPICPPEKIKDEAEIGSVLTAPRFGAKGVAVDAVRRLPVRFFP